MHSILSHHLIKGWTPAISHATPKFRVLTNLVGPKGIKCRKHDAAN